MSVRNRIASFLRQLVEKIDTVLPPSSDADLKEQIDKLSEELGDVKNSRDDYRSYEAFGERYLRIVSAAEHQRLAPAEHENLVAAGRNVLVGQIRCVRAMCARILNAITKHYALTTAITSITVPLLGFAYVSTYYRLLGVSVAQFVESLTDLAMLALQRGSTPFILLFGVLGFVLGRLRKPLAPPPMSNSGEYLEKRIADVTRRLKRLSSGTGTLKVVFSLIGVLCCALFFDLVITQKREPNLYFVFSEHPKKVESAAVLGSTTQYAILAMQESETSSDQGDTGSTPPPQSTSAECTGGGETGRSTLVVRKDRLRCTADSKKEAESCASALGESKDRSFSTDVNYVLNTTSSLLDTNPMQSGETWQELARFQLHCEPAGDFFIRSPEFRLAMPSHDSPTLTPFADERRIPGSINAEHFVITSAEPQETLYPDLSGDIKTLIEHIRTHPAHIRNNARGITLNLVGFASQDGGASGNLDLSDRRATWYNKHVVQRVLNDDKLQSFPVTAKTHPRGEITRFDGETGEMRRYDPKTVNRHGRFVAVIPCFEHDLDTG